MQRGTCTCYDRLVRIKQVAFCDCCIAQVLPADCHSSETVPAFLSRTGLLQGFPSKVRDAEEGLQDSAESVQERKQAELQRSLWDLGLAWGLVLVCCTHHLGHWLHGLGWHGARSHPCCSHRLSFLHQEEKSIGAGRHVLAPVSCVHAMLCALEMEVCAESGQACCSLVGRVAPHKKCGAWSLIRLCGSPQSAAGTELLAVVQAWHTGPS